MRISTVGPVDAKVMLVGEFPHMQDLRNGVPFTGGAGYELTKMLADAGLHKTQCLMTMVMRDAIPLRGVEALAALKKKHITPQHVFFNNKWVLPEVVKCVEELKQDILRYKPNVVCPMGNLALWALTGEWSVQNWRSSIMESTLIPGLKVIPTLNPGIVNMSWSKRPIVVHDLKRVARHRDNPIVTRPNYNFVIRPDFTTTVETLTKLRDNARKHYADTGTRLEYGGDIETRAGHIACIAFAWTELDAICIPLMCQHNSSGYWTAEEEAALVYLIYEICLVCTIVGQSWNYDAQYFYRWWHFICPSVLDTMIQQHSCFSNFEKNLAFLSSMYLEDHLYWKDDRTNWEEGPKGEGEDQYWIYNCTDAVRTLAIAQVLKSVISALGLEAVNEFQQALAPCVLRTMNRGIRCDTQARAALSIQLMGEVAEREEWMRNVTGSELNIKSPKQMQDFFYRQMGMKTIINKKTGNPTTNDEALRTIAVREPILLPVTRKISELRSLGVFHGTFVQAPLDTDGRLRTSFNVCGTETYRFSSTQNAFGTGLNMQNIPKGGETDGGELELPNVRKLFIPDPGHTFFDIDLDSADLRIVSWESECAWMKEQFKLGNKPYIEIMKEYYHDQTMSKNSHPREYAMFKSLCHGTNYLGTADGIAPRIGLLVHETERIQKWYFGLCPEIPKWQDEIKKQVAGRKYVENAFGYRMYFLDRIEGTIFNQAVAWIPQSSVGCLINRAYVNIDRNLPEVEVLLQVHDSLAGQFQTVYGDWALRRIVEEASVAIPYDDPLFIPVGVVSSTASWGECG